MIEDFRVSWRSKRTGGANYFHTNAGFRQLGIEIGKTRYVWAVEGALQVPEEMKSRKKPRSLKPKLY